MTSNFINETTLERESENSWTGNLNENWNIGNIPNGGYLLSVVLRAICLFYDVAKWKQGGSFPQFRSTSGYGPKAETML